MKLRTLLFGGLLAALSAVASAPAAAQFTPADSAALVNFRLNDETVAKFRQSIQNLAALDSSQLASMGEMEGPGEGGSLVDVAAAFDANPALKGAIERAGLTSQDWVLFLVSMVFANMVQTMDEAGMTEAVAQLKKYTNDENLAYFREHSEEIMALMQELEALSPDEEGHEHEGGAHQH